MDNPIKHTMSSRMQGDNAYVVDGADLGPGSGYNRVNVLRSLWILE